MLSSIVHLSSIVAAGMVLYAGSRVVKGEKKITDRLFEKWTVAFFLVTGLMLVWDLSRDLNNNIPDGEYDIKVEAHSSSWEFARYFPAVLSVQTYIDSEPYRDTDRLTKSTQYTLCGVFYGKKRTPKNWRKIDIEVYPPEVVDVEINDKPCTLTIEGVSASSLGVTPADNWRRQPTTNKIMYISVPILCALGAIHGMLIDNTEKRRLQKWAER
jgi:hypothetical protein